MDKQATDILKSKKFWSGLIGLAGMILVALIPELEQHMDTLIPSIVTVVGAMIGGYAVQDFGKEKYKPVIQIEHTENP